MTTAVLDRIRAWPDPMIGRERLADLDADDVDQTLTELHRAGAIVPTSRVVFIVDRSKLDAERAW
ncbi:hypothetical protein ABT332_06595 [Saccharomonospora azurea]|uniref:hypothetical protein n=1 Tax=Saccharomonospora azurea TaxID=40988 RepID=UPI003320AAD8